MLGGTCAIPGAFGCGKTVISQALSKVCCITNIYKISTLLFIDYLKVSIFALGMVLAVLEF